MIDVNKVISESVEHVMSNKVITENSQIPNVQVQNQTQTQTNNDQTVQEDENTGEYSPINAAIPSAIAAGLGAVALRNRLRSVDSE